MPNLCLFPEAITPNHHALVSEFVLLDNFYVESEVSADGHEWSMGAYATDFVERIWPLGYRGDRRVPYPAEGAHDEAARPAGGYLWDKAAAKGVSYRSYGEFVANGRTAADPGTATVKALEGHFDPMFRSFDMDYPDVKRTDRFLEELAGFEKAGEMPQLSIVRLPNDHTSGTRRRASGPSRPAWATTTWHSGGSSRASRRAGSGSRWRSSWSKTTLRTARTTSTRTGRSPWRSARTSSGIRSIRRCTARRRCCARWS